EIVDDTNRFPSTVSPGQAVTISGPTFDPAKPTAIAKLFPMGSDQPKDATDAKDAQVTAPKQVTVTLPANIPPGRYYVVLTYQGTTERVPGELRVEGNAVTLDSAYPTTAYRSTQSGFDFEVIGQNFNVAVPRDNQIYVSGQGPIIRDWSLEKSHCDTSTN